jgi:hypothetical protein
MLINTIDATLMYYHENKWNIFDIYQNEDEEKWTIEKEAQHFTLD